MRFHSSRAIMGLVLGLGLVLAACAQRPVVDVRAPGADDLRPVARPASGDSAAAEATPAGQDAAAATGELGRTVVSLGDATRPGFWLETPLASAPGPGRVIDPATGKAIAVDLVPIEGPVTAGSRLSLQAMRALGLPLTGLVEVVVLAG